MSANLAFSYPRLSCLSVRSSLSASPSCARRVSHPSARSFSISSASRSSDPPSSSNASPSSSDTPNKKASPSQKLQASDEHGRQSNKQKVSSATLTDAEIQRRLEEISGEGGAAGIEFEDGKPATVKQSVRDNFFRYI